ncbi:type VII toxin-antitoxin system MntA family adenylyltransferase antitoxin [Thermovibrio sp.]
MAEEIEKLVHYLKGDPNVIFAYLFGSYALGLNGRDSDIDIAVYFKEPPEGDLYLELLVKLSEVAGRDVDLLVLNRASPFMRYHVLKSGKLLFSKSLEVLADFKEKTLKDYDEYLWLRKAYGD